VRWSKATARNALDKGSENDKSPRAEK
jgi:hypothetical protein